MPGIRLPFNCITCKTRTKPKNRRKINAHLKQEILQQFQILATETDVICNKCHFKHFYKLTPTKSSKSQKTHVDFDSDEDYIPPVTKKYALASPPSVMLNIPATPKSHSKCFICKRPGPKLIVVPSEARFSAFVEHNVIIKSGTRCCPVHMDEHVFKLGTLKSVNTAESAYVNRATVLELLTKLRAVCQRSTKRLDFSSLNNNEYLDLTGISRAAFNDICSCVEGHIRNTPTRDVQTTVGIFFFKLRSGLSNKLLSVFFGITKSSIRRAITSVRQTLMRECVPHNLGLQHISRQELIQNHTRQLATTLFTDGSGDSSKLILVLNGTYIYIQKSQNHRFQRRSYSLHKGRPLVKPMLIVTTTGYYLTIVGPYLSDAKNNDAKILNHILNRNIEDIKSYIRPDDIFVVDRGFRDSLQLLEDMGIQSEMPSFLPKGQAQFGTEVANTSRLVTKIRWVVESANARIKRWKYFDRVLPNSQVPFIGDMLKIICAACNKYLPPLSSSTEDDERKAQEMLQLTANTNLLQAEIEDKNLEKSRADWVPVHATELEDFPRLNEDKLRNLTCGVYQLKMSPGYIQEHLQNGTDIRIHKEYNGLVRVRLQSRHVSAKQYTLWVKFNSEDVIGWYCKCRSGARVVGMCAHCAAIIWYLGYAKQRFVNGIGVRDWCEYVDDAGEVQPTIDSSDSESE